MSKFAITSKAGVSFGVYEGESKEVAFRAMVADGGGEHGSPEVGTEADWIITEIAEPDGAGEISSEGSPLVVSAVGGTQFQAFLRGEYIGSFAYGKLDADGQYSGDDDEIIAAARSTFGIDDDIAGRVE